jgi:hypothetical protein
MFILRDNHHNVLYFKVVYLNLMILTSCIHVIGLPILFTTLLHANVVA